MQNATLAHVAIFLIFHLEIIFFHMAKLLTLVLTRPILAVVAGWNWRWPSECGCISISKVQKFVPLFGRVVCIALITWLWVDPKSRDKYIKPSLTASVKSEQNIEKQIFCKTIYFSIKNA